mmetsp:Transcript_4865/g.10705  ORF Transcript_4865/g.10705 Transcript_4865/m.10705 type:complete len:701 (+) Transcript_4865:90-2192(+)
MRTASSLAALCAVANASSPVTRVVTLLNELKAKIEADGKGEQKIYDKFACWCEKTTARKAKDIADAKEHIEELSVEIQKRKGQLGSLTAELAQLKKDLASNKASQKEATSLRGKENAEYQQTKNEMEEAIGALEKAINALSGAGMPGAGSSLITKEAKQARIMDVAADLRGALEMAPRGIVTREQAASVSGFFANPGSFAQTGAGSKGVDAYAPASGEIVGILKDMFDTFTSNLETASATEAENLKIFEDLMAAKQKEESDLQSTLDKKEAENAEATTVEADSQQDREDTSAQLETDEVFFDETKKDCREKADDWATRTRLRTEELAGIEKAVEILTSPEAQSAFEGATSTFVQVEASPADAKTRAYNALKKISRGNARLALLAARVATQTGWHFDKVIAQIDKMIVSLRKEEKEDVAAKDNCDEMESKAKAKKADLQKEIDGYANDINKLTTNKQEAETSITDTINEIDAQKQMMEQALADRNAEHEKFVAALKDDEAAVALLGQAIEALAAYEKKNKDELSFAQREQPEQPEYTIDQDKAPDTSFSSGKKHDTESKGIVGIIEMIKEDLENEIKQEKQKEADDQAEYDGQLADDKKTMKALEARKADLEEEVAETEEKIAATTSDKKNTKNDKDAAQATLDKLKPSCDWVAQTFDKRRSNRATELESLMEAKAVLAGASEDAGDETTGGGDAFLQRKQ